MEYNITPYKQRGMTCVISCMLMILEYYKDISKAIWQYENKYYKCYRSYYIDGTPFSAVAFHFSKNNYDTEIIHSEMNIFNNSKNMFSKELFDKLMVEYKDFLEKARQKGAKIIKGKAINIELLKNKLDAGKLIILAGIKLKQYLHAVLICGYDEENFVVCDPLYKEKKNISFKEIEKYMKTPIGSWLIAVNK